MKRKEHADPAWVPDPPAQEVLTFGVEDLEYTVEEVRIAHVVQGQEVILDVELGVRPKSHLQEALERFDMLRRYFPGTQ